MYWLYLLISVKRSITLNRANIGAHPQGLSTLSKDSNSQDNFLFYFPCNLFFSLRPEPRGLCEKKLTRQEKKQRN